MLACCFPANGSAHAPACCLLSRPFLPPFLLAPAALQNWSWYSWAHMMQVDSHVGDPNTWAARSVLLAYGFLVVIIVHLYTVAVAVELTTDQLSNTITGLSDLPRKRVETAETYRDSLKAHSVFADPKPW